MAYADYLHCDQCDAKVIYTGETDVSAGAIVFCGDCAPKVEATLAALSGLPDGPRVFSLPPEPGPEVTAVRDGYGYLWLRQMDRGKNRFGWEREDKRSRSDWRSMMRHESPLTDVTGEATPCPHDTIAEAAGIRVCLDCNQVQP